MEPPAKRLRILQSVQVDEDNADYLQAKQKQQKKLKSTMESIFAKYEAMHESMSDIIDMKANKVIVDRGHLRRLQRKAHRSETSLLDTIGLSASKYDEALLEEKEEYDDDDDAKEASEDELAPTQCPTASRKELAVPPTTFAHTLPVPQSIPQTPGPANGMLQLIQFPQTPAGQQAQNAFYTTLAHTINQAVQQAVAPLFSQVLPNIPDIQQPVLQRPLVAPSLTTPPARVDKVAPATDPKWAFPPLPVVSPEHPKAPYSPIPLSTHAAAPSAAEKKMIGLHTLDEETQKPGLRETQIAQVHSRQTENEVNPCLGLSSRRRSPRVVVQTGKARAPRYLFTEEDAMYINKKKHEKSTWASIRDSREKWRTWPLWAFHNHWHLHLKTRNLQEDSSGSGPHAAYTTQDNEKESTIQVHHLPTPSSSRHEDHLDETVEPEVLLGRNDCTPPHTGCYNDGERESLSAIDNDYRVMTGVGEDELYNAEPGDIVLPSIETAIGVGREDTGQQHLLGNSSTTKPVSINKTAHSFNTQKANQRRSPLNLPQTMPDAEAETGISFGQIIANPLADTPSKSTPIDDGMRRSTSIDLVGDKEDLAPITPQIKRESSTPRPLPFLCCTPTPNPNTHTSSSNAKSIPRISNKAFHKQIKQSWATKTGTPRPKGTAKALLLQKRKSFPTLGLSKPTWGQGEEKSGSEDELAM